MKLYFLLAVIFFFDLTALLTLHLLFFIGSVHGCIFGRLTSKVLTALSFRFDIRTGERSFFLAGNLLVIFVTSFVRCCVSSTMYVPSWRLFLMRRLWIEFTWDVERRGIWSTLGFVVLSEALYLFWASSGALWFQWHLESYCICIWTI